MKHPLIESSFVRKVESMNDTMKSLLSELENNKNMNNTAYSNLEFELKKIDDIFEKELDTLNLMEENNLSVLKSINVGKIISNENEGEADISKIPIDTTKDSSLQEPLKERKSERGQILNNKIILDSLPHIIQIKDENQKMKELINTDILVLCDRKLIKIANLEIYENLQELHLERNFIKVIENFTYLKKLEILNLNNNYIKELKNISHLENLQSLDIGDNLIEEFSVNEIPKNIIILNLFDNLFYDKTPVFNFRSCCIRNLPKLESLDFLPISIRERLILSDEKNLQSKKKNYEKQLSNIKSHYELVRNDRRTFVENYYKNMKKMNFPSFSINNSETNKTETTVSTTNNSTNKRSLEDIKNNLKSRVTKFEEMSKQRFKGLDEKLSEVRTNFHNHINNYDKTENVERVREKIRNAVKYDIKMQLAEEKLKEVEAAVNLKERMEKLQELQELNKENTKINNNRTIDDVNKSIESNKLEESISVSIKEEKHEDTKRNIFLDESDLQD
jgi:hypothetical protein